MEHLDIILNSYLIEEFYLYIQFSKTINRLIMKKIWVHFKLLLVLLFLSSFSKLGSQICLPGNTIFDSQEKIDNFLNSNPNCTIIDGDVTIGHPYQAGSTVNNLNGLKNIIKINGDLIIRANYYLTNLAGLNNLVEVGGDFKIEGNNTLSSISDFNQLKLIKGKYSINDNLALNEISGFNKLVTIEGKFSIHSMSKLSIISGFNELLSVDGLELYSLNNVVELSKIASLKISDTSSVFINYCPKLKTFINLESSTKRMKSLTITDCDNFENLNSISSIQVISENITLERLPLFVNLSGLKEIISCGNLRIANINKLKDLSDLKNLKQVNGFIEIIGLPLISSLDGLENITKNKLQANSSGLKFILRNNPKLSDCTQNCDLISLPESEKLIELNAPGCATNRQAWVNCNLHKCSYSSLNFKTQSQIDSFLIQNKFCEYLFGDICIGACDSDYVKGKILNLKGLNNLDTIIGSITIKNISNLNLADLGGLRVVNGNFKSEDNQNLSFDNFFSGIGGSFVIKNSSILGWPSTFKNQIGIGGDFVIDGVSGTINWKDFEKLEYINGDFIIANNNNLVASPSFLKPVRVLGSLIFENNLKLSGINYNITPINYIGVDFKFSNNPIAPWIYLKVDSIHGKFEIDQIANGSQNGFSFLKYIGGDLIIKNYAHNFSQNFNSLNQINGKLHISGCSGILNFVGFNYLDKINGSLEIIANSNLTSLEGLHMIEPKSIKSRILGEKDLNISDNPKLNNCDLENLCNIIHSIGKNIYISNNNGRCNSVDDLKTDCDTIECPLNLNIFSQSEIDNFDRKYYNCDYVEKDISIQQNITNLHGLKTIKSIGGNLNISGTSCLDLVGLDNLEFIGGNLSISSNEKLTSLFGLKSINRLKNVTFIDNKSLLHLKGMDNLKFIERINFLNVYLNSFQGLEKIDTILNFSAAYSKNLYSLQGLEGLKYFNKMDFNSNDNLSNITSLDNIPLQNDTRKVYISGNKKLSICNTNFICRTLRHPMISLNIINNGPNCKSVSDIDCKKKTTYIEVFLDENRNQVQDFGEKGISNVLLSVEGDPANYLSNLDGNIEIICEEDRFYKIKLQQDQLTWKLSTSNQEYNFQFISANSSDTIFKFGLYPNSDFHKLSIQALDERNRCNELGTFEIIYKNEGTYEESGEIKIKYDPSFKYIESYPLPVKIDEVFQEIYYNYNGILAQDYSKIKIKFLMPGQNSVATPKSLVSTINNKLSSSNPISAVHKLETIIRCAYDPNDKVVNPVGNTEKNLTKIGSLLEYTIRFQNTGNDFAREVAILDTLSQYLDVSTFRIINSSHQVSVSLKGNIVTFYFKDIILPDSNTSKIESQGFVTFAINHINGILEGSEVLNSSSIYFDQNIPVLTNTVVSKLIKEITNSDLEINKNKFIIYPNPNNGILKIEHPTQKIKNVELYNLYGVKIEANIKINNNFTEITIIPGANNTFIAKVIDERNNQNYFKLIIQK